VKIKLEIFSRSMTQSLLKSKLNGSSYLKRRRISCNNSGTVASSPSPSVWHIICGDDIILASFHSILVQMDSYSHDWYDLKDIFKELEPSKEF
jgi:hypothetical protein